MAFGDFTVTRASTKNVLGSAGLYVSVANNVPAFEFNADGSYRGLLVEPAATNICLQSQTFDNATWSKTRATVTSNATTAPDGTTTADKIVEDTSASTDHRITQSITTVLSLTYTYSVFVKASERSQIALFESASGTLKTAVFNVSNGTIVSQSAGLNASITAFPSGWYRCAINIVNVTNTAGVVAYMALAVGGSVNYTGDGTSGIFVWQAQLETGNVATSPIVTVASTVARSADVVSLTSASSLIGQTSGGVYIEYESAPVTVSPSRWAIQVDDGTVANRILLIRNTNATISCYIETASVVQATITTAGSPTGICKALIAYNTNDIAFSFNGVTVGTDSSATIPATSRIILGGSSFIGWIRSVALFPTRLSNATSNEITTL